MDGVTSLPPGYQHEALLQCSQLSCRLVNNTKQHTQWTSVHTFNADHRT